MNLNPVSDVIAFLLQPTWATVVFWLLVLASVAVAIYSLASIPGQRRATRICDWAFRFLQPELSVPLMLVYLGLTVGQLVSRRSEPSPVPPRTNDHCARTPA